MQTFYFTDPGKVRSHNEDSVTILSNDKKEFILAIADGMGGHKAGEVASKIAIDYITTAFYKKETIGSKDEAIEWLRTIVKEINNKIWQRNYYEHIIRNEREYLEIIQYINNNPTNWNKDKYFI